MKNPYNIMAAVAATACIPCLYVAAITITVGDDTGWVLAGIGGVLAGLAAVYEGRSHRLREWLLCNHSIQ